MAEEKDPELKINEFVKFVKNALNFDMDQEDCK